MLRLPLVASLLLAAATLPAAARGDVVHRFSAVAPADPDHASAGERQLRLWARAATHLSETLEIQLRADGVAPGPVPLEPLVVTQVRFDDGIGVLRRDDVVVVPPLDDSVRFVADPHPGPGSFSFSASGPEGPLHHGVGSDDDWPLLLLVPFDSLNLGGVTGIDVVFAALRADPAIGDLRVSLTVEGFAGGGSEQFELDPVPVPEPAAAAGAGAALAALGALRRRAQASAGGGAPVSGSAAPR